MYLDDNELREYIEVNLGNFTVRIHATVDNER